MLKKSEVLNQNIEQIIFNYTTSYIWEGKDIKQLINKTLNYYNKDFGLENDITTDQIKQYIVNTIKLYCSDYQAVKKAINKLKESWMIKNTEKFFASYGLPFKTVKDYQVFINNNLLSDIQ